jgi:hypothetical protein
MVCTAFDLVFKINYGSGIEADGPSSVRILGYRCGGTASALFIAHILDHVASIRGLIDSNFCDFAEHPGIELLDESGRLFVP